LKIEIGCLVQFNVGKYKILGKVISVKEIQAKVRIITRKGEPALDVWVKLNDLEPYRRKLC
jgi:hypothetical protein